MVVDGFIVVDKPGGMTSHDVVARVRRLAKTRRVGHGGTLDPMATGVLIVGVNRATRLLTYVIGARKSYLATIRLGESTVTDDAEGEVTARASTAAVTDEAIRAGLAAQTGEIEQVPSAVSAIKINGQRAYKRVREGEDVELPARKVTVHSLDVLAIRRPLSGMTASSARNAADAIEGGGGLASGGVIESGGGHPSGGAIEGGGGLASGGVIESGGGHPSGGAIEAGGGAIEVDIDVTVSSGTYIRAIARDLGRALGVGGHLTALRRTAVGDFGIDIASTLAELEERAPDVIGVPMADAARRAFPQRTATPDEAKVLRHGGPLDPVGIEGPYAVFDESGEVLAIVSEREGRTRAEIVLAPA